MQRRIACCLLALLTGACAARSGEVQYPSAGVLEIGEVRDSDLGTRVPVVQVRYAFYRSSDGWEATSGNFDQSWRFPQQMTWHVAQDGRQIGAVTTSADATSAATKGIHAFAQSLSGNPGQVPRIPLGSLQISYRGWNATARPLLLTTSPGVADPEGWKPAQLAPQELRRVRDAFRTDSPVVSADTCHATTLTPDGYAQYPDEAITLLSAYRSKDGHLLVEMKFNAQKVPCEQVVYARNNSWWLAADPDGTAYDVGLNLTPLGAADLDGDGHSEWLFKSRPTSCCGDEDVYSLFYDGFRKQVSMSWK